MTIEDLGKKARIAVAASLVVSAAGAAELEAEQRSGTLEEIVVTAQKRAQSLQDVPIAVSVIQASDLESSRTFQVNSLPQVSPGLTVDTVATYSQVYIRGVGSEFVQPGANQSVSTYVDGVVIPVPTNVNQYLLDVERVEVLKGPQGTLFGRNSAGGAISIVTKKPPKEFEGVFKIGGGNLSARSASLYAGGPVAGGLRLSLAGFYDERETWVTNLGGDQLEGLKGYGGRFKAFYESDGGFQGELSALVQQRYDGESFAYNQLQPNSLGAGLGFTGSAEPGIIYGDAFGKNFPAWVAQLHETMVTLRLQQSLSFADLVSITGYRDSINRSGSEFDSTDGPLGWFYSHQPEETITQELQLVSKSGGSLEWVTGLYYFTSDGGYDALGVPDANQNLFLIYSTGTQESAAVFLQGRYAVTDKFGITLGGRYSQDKAEFDGFSFVVPSPRMGATDEEWSDFSPRLALDYKLGDTLLYASISKGYKAGSYNLSNTADVGPVDPEEVWAAEVGFKSEIGGIARVEGSAFAYDYKDLQVSFIPSNADPTRLANAAKSKLAGVEFAGLLQPTDALKITGGLAWLFEAEYDSFPGGTAYVDNAIANPAFPFGYSVVPEDFKGNRMPHAPEFTANLGATYEWTLSGGASLHAGGNVFYRGSQWFSPQNVAITKGDAITLVNADLTLRSADEHWSISAWGTNLGDEEYLSSVLQTTIGTIGLYAPPRLYGVSLGYSF